MPRDLRTLKLRRLWVADLLKEPELNRSGVDLPACRYCPAARATHSIRAVPVASNDAVVCPWECRATQREVAAFIRRAREACGLTQHQLAQRLGSTQPVVARWETGNHEITMRALARIADALGVQLVVRFGSEETSWRHR